MFGGQVNRLSKYHHMYIQFRGGGGVILYKSRSISNKFPTIFLGLTSHFRPQVRFFFVEKGNVNSSFRIRICDGDSVATRS